MHGAPRPARPSGAQPGSDAMQDETRRLAAILSIDAVGFTRLMASSEAAALAVLRRHREGTLAPAWAQHGGRVFHAAGDGFLVEFPSIVDAVAAALAVQRAIGRSNADVPPGQRMDFRIGLNLGDVIVDGEDLYGSGVNIAARVQGLARAGDIVATRAVKDQADGRIGAQFAPLGARRLKNVDTPVELFQVLAPGARLPAQPLPARIGLAAAAAAAAIVALGLVVLQPQWLLTLTGALRGPPATTAVPQAARPVVAVLPFTNQTGEAQSDYLVDGFTADVIGALGRYGTLTVMSRNATAAYRPQPGAAALPTAEAGRTLGARYLVEGAIRRSNGQHRVSAQLAEAQSGAVLWTASFDEGAFDLLAAQDAIVREIAGHLAARVVQVEGRNSAGKSRGSLAAYDLLLRARAAMELATRGGHVAARGLLDRALTLDPGYAELYATYAQLMYDRSQRGWAEQPAEGFQEAERLANRAIELDPASAGGFAQLARVHAVFERYEDALAAADRAADLNPSDPVAQGARAGILLWLGRPGEAIETIAMLRRIEPQPAPEVVLSLGLAHLVLGGHDAARAAIEANLVRFPDYSYLYAVLAGALAELGRAQEAAAAVAELQQRDPFFTLERFGARFRLPADRERVLAALRKAGLK